MKNIILLCTALNGVGGTSSHMAQIYRGLDRSRFHPIIVFSSSDPVGLTGFFLEQGCSQEDLRVIPRITRHPLACLSALRRVWQEDHPDCVHSFFLHSDILSFMSTFLLKGIWRVSSVEGKFIWDHGNGVGRVKHLFYSVFNRLIRNGFSRTVTVSEDLRREVLRAGGDLGRVVVIPVGVPVVPAVDVKPRPENTRIVVGCMSRFSPDKGVDLFVEAIGCCAQDLPQVRFVVAGAGGDENKLKVMVERSGLSERIDFPGWVRDVAGFLATIDIFVMPSRREGCPLALIEAMMHGKAIVTFDAAGVNEIVSNGDTALVAPAFDVAAMGAAIARLVKDGTQRKSLGERARTVAVERYSLSREISSWEDLYMSLGTR